MKEILNKISQIVIEYEGGSWVSVDNLRVMLRELTANHYHLTKYNIEYGKQHNMEIYNFKGSDVAGKRFAELKVPELRETRKILSTAKNVIDSMRSELSIIKNET